MWGASSIDNNIKVLYNKEVALTSENQNIPLSDSSSNYNFLVVRLRSEWNYSSTWIISKLDYSRNNAQAVFDNDGNFDIAFTQGITNTNFPIKNIKSARGLYLMSIWGMFPI